MCRQLLDMAGAGLPRPDHRMLRFPAVVGSQRHPGGEPGETLIRCPQGLDLQPAACYITV